MHKVFSCIAIVALLFCTAEMVVAQGRPDEVAVTVNGEPISTWEIGLLLPVVRSELKIKGVEPKGKILITTALQRAIDSRLLAQEARRRGIEPNEKRIDEKMAALADGAGGRATLEAELIKGGVAYSQLRATVVQTDSVQTLVETQVTAGIKVTDEDVAAFYAENPELFNKADKVHVRHILFIVEDDADAQQRETAREKAVAARKRAVAGEDFTVLAAELSEGPNAERGGDLGFTARGQMVEAFDEVVWSLEVGEISDVVESHVGFHVIKVEEFVVGETIPVEEAQPYVEDLLRQERTGQALFDLITELRASAEITEPTDDN